VTVSGKCLPAVREAVGRVKNERWVHMTGWDRNSTKRRAMGARDERWVDGVRELRPRRLRAS